MPPPIHASIRSLPRLRNLLSGVLLASAAFGQAPFGQAQGDALTGAPAGSLEAGYRQMYNLQFAAAHQTFQDWQRSHTDDPLAAASDAAQYLFSEFDRSRVADFAPGFFTHDQHFVTDNKLSPDPVLRQHFQQALTASRTLANRQAGGPRAEFAAVLCDGLESDYTALIEKRYAASFVQMKAGRARAERLLAANPTYYDAWLAVGVENYMLMR